MLNEKRGSDGSDYELRSRLVDLDPLSQQITLEMCAEQWRGDELVAQEKHLLKMTLYFTHEIVLMLERAGFVDIRVEAGYTGAGPTSDDDFVVFVAGKPE